MLISLVLRLDSNNQHSSRKSGNRQTDRPTCTHTQMITVHVTLLRMHAEDKLYGIDVKLAHFAKTRGRIFINCICELLRLNNNYRTNGLGFLPLVSKESPLLFTRFGPCSALLHGSYKESYHSVDDNGDQFG